MSLKPFCEGSEADLAQWPVNIQFCRTTRFWKAKPLRLSAEQSSLSGSAFYTEIQSKQARVLAAECLHGPHWLSKMIFRLTKVTQVQPSCLMSEHTTHSVLQIEQPGALLTQLFKESLGRKGAWVQALVDRTLSLSLMSKAPQSCGSGTVRYPPPIIPIYSFSLPTFRVR